MNINDLPDLQAKVDAIDSEIIDLLKLRFGHSRTIGDLKLTAGQAPYDPQRVTEQVERFVADSAAQGLEPTMARQIISILIAQVLVERMAIIRPMTMCGDRPAC